MDGEQQLGSNDQSPNPLLGTPEFQNLLAHKGVPKQRIEIMVPGSVDDTTLDALEASSLSLFAMGFTDADRPDGPKKYSIFHVQSVMGPSVPPEKNYRVPVSDAMIPTLNEWARQNVPGESTRKVLEDTFLVIPGKDFVAEAASPGMLEFMILAVKSLAKQKGKHVAFLLEGADGERISQALDKSGMLRGSVGAGEDVAVFFNNTLEAYSQVKLRTFSAGPADTHS